MDPALITAWATVAIAAATVTVGGATCFLIWRGIREMRRSSDERARARETAAAELAEWRDADIRRHEEAQDADIRRHEEALAADRSRHEEAMAKLQALHGESMTALRVLIERTGSAAPAE